MTSTKMNKKTKKTFITKMCFVSFVGIANFWEILSIKTVTLKCGPGQISSFFEIISNTTEIVEL